MEGWVTHLIGYGATAAVSAIGGIWVHVRWAREERMKADLRERQMRADSEQKQREADLREQQRQAEFDEFKKKRRLVGGKEVERLERAGRYVELMAKLKQHQITPEEFNEFREDLIAGRRPRRQRKPQHYHVEVHEQVTASDRYSIKQGGAIGPGGHVQFLPTPDDEQPAGLTLETFLKQAPFDPRMTDEQRLLLAQHLLDVFQHVGLNDYPIGYDGKGNKVEWIRTHSDDVAEGADPFSPMILFRNEGDIHAATEEFFEKVWWNRHQNYRIAIERGEEKLTDAQRPFFEAGAKRAKELEEKYGAENLGWDDFEWGMINGKLSALRWVTGSEWDDLDT